MNSWSKWQNAKSPSRGGWRPWRLGIESLALALLAPPWLLCAWLGELIASGRWNGAGYALSVTLILSATLLGWRACWRLVARWSDVTVADFLRQAVEPAEPWALFVEPEQVVRSEHLAHCRRRWKVSPQSSGWRHLRQEAWKRDALIALICVPLASHPWRWLVG